MTMLDETTQWSCETCSVTGRKPLMMYVGKMKKNLETDKDYAAFYGVPYAKPPKGRKRYQAPESLTCSEPNPNALIPICIANETDKCSAQIYNDKKEGSADCLYMNIFLPRRLELIDHLLPVLVYIHGGGFTYGSNDPNVYGPDYLIQHDLVVITINYRLGPHGFLNLHTKDCPGNVGLKDQVKALEWIRDNIDCFKGDPHNVTISGNSAGATCVNLHLIAPASRDLFHKAIVQSGGIYTPWGFRACIPEQTQVLLNDWTVRYYYEQEEDMWEFHETARGVLEDDRAERHPLKLAPYYGPSLETIAEGAFIPDDLEEMMKNVNHDKPVMAGITKLEGISLLSPHTPKHENLVTWIEKRGNIRKLLADTLRWSSETAGKFVEQISEKYFPNNSKLVADKSRCFANLLSDICFRRFYDCFKFGPNKTVHKNLYVYRFDHFSEMSTAYLYKLHNFHEPTHEDELKYLFYHTKIRDDLRKYIDEGPHQNKEIKIVINHVCSLWANFCKTGVPSSDFDPSVKWRPHTEEEPCYLSIKEVLELKEESLFQEQWSWFNNIVDGQRTVESSPPSPQDDSVICC